MLTGLDKIIITDLFDEVHNGLVIGVKPEKDNSNTFLIEPRRKDFRAFKHSKKLLRINSKDIDSGRINIKKH